MFNTQTVKTSNKTQTYEGGPAIVRGKELELTLNILGSLMSTDMFYEKVDTRISRIQELSKQVNPGYLDKLAMVARQEFNLRTPPAVLMAVKTLQGKTISQEAVASVFSRGDEVTEYLSAIKALSDKKIFVSQSKKVAASVLNNLTERKALRYMGGSKAMSLADAIRISHPVPQGAKQSALFKFVSLKDKEGSLTGAWDKLTEGEKALLPLVQTAVSGSDTGEISWERAKSAGQSDWTVLVKTMGYMAILRNLRNFITDVPVTQKEFWSEVLTKLSDKDEVAKSKQLPYRFYSAYKAVQSMSGDARLKAQVMNAIVAALDHSAFNLPVIPGKTLIAVDSSGSMDSGASSRGTAENGESITYREIGAVLGSAMALAQSATLVTWATGAKVKPLHRSVMDTILSLQSGEVGHGTDPNAIHRAVNVSEYDTLVILTDGQFASHFDLKGFKGKVYFVDLTGYKPGFEATGKPNVTSIGGWSDATLKLIAMDTQGDIVSYVKNYTGNV